MYVRVTRALMLERSNIVIIQVTSISRNYGYINFKGIINLQGVNRK